VGQRALRPLLRNALRIFHAHVCVERALLRNHSLAFAALFVALAILMSPTVHALTFGSPVRITTNTGTSEYPSVAASGSYVYVAWEDHTPVAGSGTQPEIWTRVSSNNGASFGSAIRISTNTYDLTLASVAASGGYVYVAWQDSTPVTGSGSSPEIWMRLSSNGGASFGSAVRISYDTSGSFLASAVIAGGYVYVAWQDDLPVAGSGTAPEIWVWLWPPPL